MAAGTKTDQRITRLTPLGDVLAHIDSKVKPAAPRGSDVMSALGFTLAEDILGPSPLPAQAIALRDGLAVEADTTRDASSYAPLTLSAAPQFVSAGETMPAGTDAILALDAVEQRNAHIEILTDATPGDGVLAQGADAQAGSVLLKAGTRLHANAIAVLRAANIHTASIRAPRIAIAGRKDDRIVGAALDWLSHAIAAGGGTASVHEDFASAIQDKSADAVIAIGGTGTGPSDSAVTALARSGLLSFHGIAIAPGDAAAFGFIDNRPVLLMPGRLDAVLSCWLLLGAPLLARLGSRQDFHIGRSMTLSRKIASSLGLTEIIPVACSADNKEPLAEPLASSYLSLQTIARADGWISVPAQSEGYPAGATVTVRTFP